MQIEFQNLLQVALADLLWTAQDQVVVDLILQTFGHDAYIAYQMILATSFDQVNDIDIANKVLSKIFKG